MSLGPIANVEMAAAWDGLEGDDWVRDREHYDLGIRRHHLRLVDAAAVSAGERVLDVGCGTGELSRAAGRATAGSPVVGVDLSARMLARARELADAEGLAHVTFLQADAQVHPFERAGFDVVVSRFGVMFFADPVAAFRNIRRALKPAGRLVFIAWRTPQENPWGTTPVRAAQPFLPPQPRPGPEDPGQFAFGDRARVERILGEAGFKALRFEPIDRQIWMGDTVAEVVAGAGKFGPLARAFAGAEPAAIEKAKQAIAEVLTPHEGSEGVRLPGACWLVQASAN